MNRSSSLPPTRTRWLFPLVTVLATITSVRTPAVTMLLAQSPSKQDTTLAQVPGIPTLPDVVTVIPFHPSGDTPWIMIQAEVDGHRGTFSLDTGSPVFFLNETYLHSNSCLLYTSDTFNAMSSYGAYLLALATLLFVINFFKSIRGGKPAGPNPWGAGTLEWTLPSPVPAYNFAVLPTVTARYPLWEGNDADIQSARINQQTGKTAEQLGIILPYDTIKPLFAALAMTLMSTGLLLGKPIMLVSAAAAMVIFIYAWLTSPLEPEHH